MCQFTIHGFEIVERSASRDMVEKDSQVEPFSFLWADIVDSTNCVGFASTSFLPSSFGLIPSDPTWKFAVEKMAPVFVVSIDIISFLFRLSRQNLSLIIEPLTDCS